MQPNVPKYLIVHHTGGSDADPLFDTSNQSFEVVDRYHGQRWQYSTMSALGFYCGYHYFIDKLGNVTQARKDDEGGAHTIGMNYSSIGICLAGNFDYSLPTDAQKQALASLLARLQAKYLIPSSKIVPHRTFAPKSCFGYKLPEAWAREVLQGSVIPDATVRGLIRKLVELKILLQPRLAFLFGAFNDGPLNGYDACYH